MKRIVITIFSCLSLFSNLAARTTLTLSNNAQVFLLTCTPGDPLWSRYGHSGIRIYDPDQQLDLAFNYGLFNFNVDNFYSNFAQGNTDYLLGIEPTYMFYEDNAELGRNTYEQELNLTPQERQFILDTLLENALPENRIYRYNFVFDNCATRPFSLLKQTLGKDFNAEDLSQLTHYTYRDLITHYSGKNSWGQYAINLIFGYTADQYVTVEQSLFLPELLMHYLAGVTRANGTPMVLQSFTKPFEPKQFPWIFSPMAAILLIWILGIALSIIDYKRHKQSWWLEVALAFLFGLVGCITCFLTFFSSHPFVGSNMNNIFLNPFMLALAIALCTRSGRNGILSNIGLIIITCYMIIAIIAMLISGQQFLFLALPLLLYGRLIFAGRKRLKGSFLHKKIALSILALFPLTALAQSPRLTVVVWVDGISQPAMNELRNYWQAGGLRRLSEEAIKSKASYKHFVYNGLESQATLLTGSNPSIHTISGNYYFDRGTRLPHDILEDVSATGIGTEQTISPKNIPTTTLTDEFCLHHSSQSKIYAIGIHPHNTILLAGHAANACTWIDDKSQRWVTSHYYPEGLPSTADKMNVSDRFQLAAEKIWTPRMDIALYLHPSTEEKNSKGFSYPMGSILTQSPEANKLVVELALQTQDHYKLGEDQYPDMLLLEMTVRTPKSVSTNLQTAEQEDMYLCLNQDLGYLMEQLDRKIGQNNYTLILLGGPGSAQTKENYKRAGIQITTFNLDRAAALINTFLMAKYGHERWIDGGYGQSIYLNRILIAQRKMSLTQIQQEVADFLLEFEGIQNAFIESQIPQLCGKEWDFLRNSFNKHCYGDVVFTLQPLCCLAINATDKRATIVQTDASSPLYIWSTSRMTAPNPELEATDVKKILMDLFAE